jgi:hypothetical protein
LDEAKIATQGQAVAATAQESAAKTFDQTPEGSLQVFVPNDAARSMQAGESDDWVHVVIEVVP